MGGQREAMDLEKRLEMYRSDYFFHIDFKEKIYTRMALFSVFITACITANFSMQEELMKLGCMQLSIVIILWVAAALVLAFVIYALFCITNLKSDELVNSNSEMENYRNTLRQHYISHFPDATEQAVNTYIDDHFLIYLTSQYSSCSAIFYENNVYRQKWLARLAVSSYLLLILTFIVSMFFLYQKIEGDIMSQSQTIPPPPPPPPTRVIKGDKLIPTKPSYPTPPEIKK